MYDIFLPGTKHSGLFSWYMVDACRIHLTWMYFLGKILPDSMEKSTTMLVNCSFSSPSGSECESLDHFLGCLLGGFRLIWAPAKRLSWTKCIPVIFSHWNQQKKEVTIHMILSEAYPHLKITITNTFKIDGRMMQFPFGGPATQLLGRKVNLDQVFPRFLHVFNKILTIDGSKIQRRLGIYIYIYR